MPVNKTHPPSYCHFCEDNCKTFKELQSKEGKVCVNGHVLVDSDGALNILQPKSIGTNISSHNTYRYKYIRGRICKADGGYIES